MKNAIYSAYISLLVVSGFCWGILLAHIASGSADAAPQVVTKKVEYMCVEGLKVRVLGYLSGGFLLGDFPRYKIQFVGTDEIYYTWTSSVNPPPCEKTNE